MIRPTVPRLASLFLVLASVGVVATACATEESLSSDRQDFRSEECCKRTGIGYILVGSASDCDPDPVVSMDFCEEVEICCEDNGNYQSVPAVACNGTPVDPELCELVCCEVGNGGGYQQQPAGWCVDPNGTVVAPSYC